MRFLVNNVQSRLEAKVLLTYGNFQKWNFRKSYYELERITDFGRSKKQLSMSYQWSLTVEDDNEHLKLVVEDDSLQLMVEVDS